MGGASQKERCQVRVLVTSPQQRLCDTASTYITDQQLRQSFLRHPFCEIETELLYALVLRIDRLVRGKRKLEAIAAMNNAHDISLDVSGGSVFCKMNGPAMLECNRAAASTSQPGIVFTFSRTLSVGTLRQRKL